MRDGRYAEVKITKDRLLMYTPETFPEVAIYKHQIRNDSSIIFGLSENTLRHEVSSKIEILSRDSVKLIYYGNEMILVRLNHPIKELVDTAKVKEWQQEYGKDLKTRYANIDCPDLRTEEEKNPELIDLGVVEDDFEDIEIKVDTVREK